MKRNIVEEIIYSSADVSPDFSRIEKRLSLPEKSRKTRHAPYLKRVLALFLGVLIIGGAVLGAVKLAGDDTGTGTGDTAGDGEQGGSQQGTENNGMPNFREEIFLPIMMFDFELSGYAFEYGEEINITLKLYPNPDAPGLIVDGPLTVTLLENPNFELVGEREYRIDDYKPLEHSADNATVLQFAVKAVGGKGYLDSLDFEVNYSLTDFEPYDFTYAEIIKYPYNDIDNGVCARYSIWCVNDSKGVMLAPSRFESEDDKDYDVEKKREIFFGSLDREYASGAIAEKEYLDKVYSFGFEGRPGAPIVSWLSGYEYVYASQDFVAKVILPQDLYNEIYDRNTMYEERLQKEFVYSLLEVLRYADALDEAGYNAQKQLIDKYGATLYEDLIVKKLKESIPKDIFDTILDHRFDITVGKIEGGKLGLVEDPGTFEVYAKGNIVFDPDKDIYWKNDTVNVEYKFIYGPSWYTEIADYKFVGNGFTLASDIVYENGRISLSVVRDRGVDDPSFSLEVILDTGDSETLEFYGRRIGGALIVRTGSRDRFERDCEDFRELRRGIIITAIAVLAFLVAVSTVAIKVCKRRKLYKVK